MTFGRARRAGRASRPAARSFSSATVIPTWMTAAVGEWAQISGTTAPSTLKDYCTVAVRDDGLRVELCSGPAGGHSGNITNNEVQSVRLDVAAPAWVTRLSASDSTGWDSVNGSPAYFADGRPVPRHTYVHGFWHTGLGGYIFGGSFAGSSGSGATPGNDLFVPSGDDAGDWVLSSDPDLLAERPSTHQWIQCLTPGGDGFLHYNGTSYKWDWAADTYTLWSLSGDVVTLNRGGSAFDSLRNCVVQIGGGGWFTQASGTRAVKIDWSTGVRTALSFNASAGLTDFEANAAKFVGTSLVYAADADCYYLYNGDTGSPVLTGQGAKVYKITPNGTATWDMEIVSVTGVTPADEPNNSGSYNKFFYVPRWRCLFLVVSGQSIYYLRVA